MENRLIFKKSNPETASEKFQPPEKGETEYLKILDEIENADPNDINQLYGILKGIDILYKTLQQSGNGPEGLQSSYQGGNFFRKLFVAARDKFKDSPTFQKFNSEILDTLNLAKAVTDPRYQAVLRLMWLADPDHPEGFLDSLIKKHPGKWDEAQIKTAVAFVGGAGRFYAFQDIGYATHYVRTSLKSLYAHYDTEKAKDLGFKSSLEHQKDHFEFAMEFKLDWLNNRGRNRLALLSNNDDSQSLYGLGKNAQNDAGVLEIIEGRLGNFEGSSDVSDILATAGIPAVGGTDKTNELYYARPILFAILATHFYRGVIENPNPGVTNVARKWAYKKSTEVFDTYPELRYQYSADFQRAESAEEVAENISVEGAVLSESHLPLLKIDSSKKSQTAFGNLMTAEGKFNDSSNAVVIALQQNEEVGENLCDDLTNGCSELQARLEELFGVKQIVELNPDLKQKVDETVSYYDLFALSLQNAVYLSEARTELDRLEPLSSSEWAENFGDLEHVYRTLRDSSHLPPEYVAEYQDLLDRAEDLYTHWAIVLKRPPELVGESPYTASPYLTDDIYEEDQDYTYSPMVDISSEGVTETAEIPEKMSLQLNRLRVIESLAISLLAVNRATGEDAGYVEPIFGAIEDIEQDLIAYYTGEEYDGKTVFDLEEAIAGDEAFETFLVAVTMLFEEPKATLQSEKPSGFEEYINKKHGLHHVRDVAVANLRKSPFYGDLVALLKGSDNLTMANVKRAGAFIAVFQRQYLDDYATSRALMTKLLQPHMAKSRENVPETVKRSCYAKARHCAIMQVGDYLNSGGREEIRASVSEAFEKSAKREPSEDEINIAYYEFVSRTQKAQADVIYEMYLNEAAMSPGIFEFFGKSDAADKAIVKEYRASLGIASAGMFVIDDKTKEIFEKIATFVANLVVEIVLVGLSVLAAGLAGGLVSRLVSRSRLAVFLLGAKRFETLARLAYLGMTWGTRLTAEAATFQEVYPWLKGEKKLHEELTSLEGVRRATQRLCGEMAMFGAFHVVGFLGKMLKQGEVGRSLIRLAINRPEYATSIEGVFAVVNRASSGEEALKLLKGLRGLPEEVATHVRLATGNVDLLRERYLRIISSLPQDTQLVKVCGFLVQDLQFDVLAMILGTAVKNNVVPADLVEEIDLTTRETWFQMYTMAAGFRLAFTAAGYAKRGAVPAWKYAKKGVKAAAAYAERGVESAWDAVAAESPLEKIPRIRRRVREIEETELSQYAGDPKRTRQLRYELAELKGEERKALAEMQQPVDRVVPSYIARVLPKGLRLYLYRHYVNKNGEFVGSDGLCQMLAGNDAEFGEAMRMIGTAKRSLLSTNQTLVVVSQLSPTRCKLFLEATHKILSPRERYLLEYEAKRMTNESLVPDWFKAESPRVRTAAWAHTLISWLITGAVAITAVGDAVAKVTKPKIAPPEGRPVATCPMRPEDFHAGEKPEGDGIFVVRESEYAKMENAKASSNVLIFRGDTSGKASESATPLQSKEWGEKSAEKLFSQDSAGDQKAIFDNLRKAGANEGLVSDMEKAFDAFPDSMKPYVRIIATVEGDDVTPYFVIDKDGLQALVYKELGKLRGELQEIAGELREGLRGLEGDERLEVARETLGLENFVATIGWAEEHPEVMQPDTDFLGLNPDEMMGWVEGHPEALQAGLPLESFVRYILPAILIIIVIKNPRLLLRLFTINPVEFFRGLLELFGRSVDVLLTWYLIAGVGDVLGGLWDVVPYPHSFLANVIGTPLTILAVVMLLLHRGTRERYLGYLRAIRNRLGGRRGGGATPGGGETPPETPARSLTINELPPLDGEGSVLAEDSAVVSELLSAHRGELNTDHQRLLSGVDNRIELFYKAIVDLFTNHLRFPDTDAGRGEAVAAFRDVIRARYLSMVMDALIQIRRNPGTYSEGLLRDIEGRLSSCIKALAGLRTRLNNALPSVANIPNAAATRRAINEQIEAEMQSQGYDNTAITDAQEAAGLLFDLIAEHPNLSGDVARYRYIKALLGFLEPRYRIAQHTVETNPNPTESPQREIVADAQNVIDHYNALRTELEGMGGIDKARVRLAGMDQRRRRILIGVVLAALGGAGYTTYWALTRGEKKKKEDEEKAKRAKEGAKKKKIEEIEDSGSNGAREAAEGLSEPQSMPSNLTGKDFYKDPSGVLRRRGDDGSYQAQPNGSVIRTSPDGKNKQLLPKGGNVDKDWKPLTLDRKSPPTRSTSQSSFGKMSEASAVGTSRIKLAEQPKEQHAPAEQPALPTEPPPPVPPEQPSPPPEGRGKSYRGHFPPGAF